MPRIESIETYPRVTLFIEERRRTNEGIDAFMGRIRNRDSRDALRLVRLSGIPYELGESKEFDVFDIPAMDFYNAPESMPCTVKDLYDIKTLIKSVSPEVFERYLNGEDPLPTSLPLREPMPKA